VSDEKGAAMTIALVAVALLVALGASLFQQVKHEVRMAKTEATGEQALSAAEAGWNVAFGHVKAGNVSASNPLIVLGPTELTFDDGSGPVRTGAYVADASRLSANCYYVESVGRTETKGGGTMRRVIRGYVRYDSSAPLNSRWKWCYECNKTEVGC
jgi:hypothetical protein